MQLCYTDFFISLELLIRVIRRSIKVNKHFYTVVCVSIAASLGLLNITYAANAPVNATADTAAQAKTAKVSGVAAANTASQNKTEGAVAGPYFGINVGSGGMYVTYIPDSTKDTIAYYDTQKGGFTVYGYVGYLWSFSKMPSLKLGLEGGYNYIQDTTYILNEQKWVYSGYAINLFGVVHYNIAGSGFFLLGKAGVAFVSQNLEMTGYGDSKSDLRQKFLPAVGAGLGYDFTKNFEANITVTHIQGTRADPVSYGNTSLSGGVNNVMPINAVTIGAAYHLG